MIDRRVASLLLLLASLACAKKETTEPSATAANAPAATTTTSTTASAAPAAPAAAPAAAAASASPAVAGIATSDGEVPGVAVTVKELKRDSGGTVSLKFVIVNNSDKSVGFGYNFGDPDHEIKDHGSVGGVHLIDPVGKKKYFVARDADSKCICSQGMHDIEKGQSANAWAKFPAPPDDVQKISVVIPHFSPMDDVPITK